MVSIIGDEDWHEKKVKMFDELAQNGYELREVEIEIPIDALAASAAKPPVIPASVV